MKGNYDGEKILHHTRINMIKNEKEYDLKEVLYNVVIRWKSIIICSIICAALFIMYKIVNNNMKMLLTKTFIKDSILGLIIGIVGIVFFYIVKYIASDKIHSGNEIDNNSDIQVIGVIPPRDAEHNNKNYLVNKKINTTQLNEDQAIQLIVQNLRVIKSRIAKKERINICLLNSQNKNEPIDIIEKINQITDNEFGISYSNNILNKIETTENVQKADVIVLCEYINISTYSSIKKTISKIEWLGKKVSGIIVVY